MCLSKAFKHFLIAVPAERPASALIANPPIQASRPEALSRKALRRCCCLGLDVYVQHVCVHVCECVCSFMRVHAC